MSDNGDSGASLYLDIGNEPRNRGRCCPATLGPFRRGLFLGLGIGFFAAVVPFTILWFCLRQSVSTPSKAPWSGTVGFTPVLPSMCYSSSTSSNPMVVQILVDGKPYSVIPDTGSSNFNLASTRCGSKCDVKPKWHGPDPGPTYAVEYGTGSAVMTDAIAELSLAGVHLSRGTFGAIVEQHSGTDGFNLFPPANTDCHNTYAGILGLAYRGQDAGPDATKVNSTANGTTIPLLDQMVSRVGMPNAFALEVCARYPIPCGPRSDLTTWQPSRSCDINYNIGNFYLGGYRSSSLLTEMQYTNISDEIHYDIVLLGVTVCGSNGCSNVSFPDQIGGATENDCVCKTADCEIPLGKDEYCYFAVVDSGCSGLYMNTVDNTKALLRTMESVKMVDLPAENSTSFYFDGKAVIDARISPKADFQLWFPDVDGKPFPVHIRNDALFHSSASGLLLVGVLSDLKTAVTFQESKFPVLLGFPLLQGKVTFFDRSRKRMGFADVSPHACGTPVAEEAEIDVRGLRIDTPGVGCRRGTGSGGGCKQARHQLASSEIS